MGNMRVNVLALLVIVVGLTGCYKPTLSSGACENKQISEMASPDPQWKSVLFYRDCGATEPEVHVSVLPATTALPAEPGNVFRYLPPERPRASSWSSTFYLQQKWSAPRELSLGHDPQSKIAFAASTLGEIKIVHVAGKIFDDSEAGTGE